MARDLHGAQAEQLAVGVDPGAGHRGHGYSVAIAVAVASMLRKMGASGAIVWAESADVGAVATYVAAGFAAHEQVANRAHP